MQQNKITLTLTNDVVEKYCLQYFKEHPRARKNPIAKPYHPSINTWCILPRIQMNALKQKWCTFIQWWIYDIGYEDMMLDDFEVKFTTYMPTKRRSDPDNFSPKFIMDGFVESGFIKDDSNKCVRSLTLRTDYDKDNPRTEIEFLIHKEKY